ncbi:hypothetical protein [Actinoplanes sp. NPDC049265]|uniref:hypothetical protein n=1 Tax=Actinoplanes sp. NPDC049265 TaxID=3363902 RepID=UPI00371F0DE2
MEKSSRRNDNLLIRMRAALRRMLTESLSDQGIDTAKLTPLDDGDGFRFVLPADIASHRLIDPFLSRLGIKLRQEREGANADSRLRLRVALHCGLVVREEEGSYAGIPLKDCARLLDAQAGRDLLTENEQADLVVLLTDAFYQNVIAGGLSLDPGWFRRIPINVKESTGYGWAYVPGVPPPPFPDPAPAPRATEPPPRPSMSVVNVPGNSGSVRIDRIAGRDNHG